MSHDHSKEMAINDKTKSSKRHTSSCQPKLGGTQPKLGLTPINKRNFIIWRLVLHAAAEELSLVTGRHSTKNDVALKGKKGTLNTVSRCQRIATPLRDNSDNISLSTSHKPPCSTRPPLFTQPVMFNNNSQSTSHKPTVRQLRQPSRCTNSISTTTDNNIP